MARDRERDRPRRSDSGLRGRPRLRPELDPDRVAELVTDRTKAILPVDLAGQPADLDPLLAHGIPLVEDAAHAAESAYRGRKIGSIAEATCFSLYATKNIAAGEGGLISTNDSKVAETIESLRLMRRGDGSLYDIVVPGYKANVLASIARPARQGRAPATGASSRSMTRPSPSSTGSDAARDRVTRTPTTCTSSG